MARVVEADGDLFIEFDDLVVPDRLDQRETGLRVLYRIERLYCLLAFSLCLLIGPLRLLLVDVSAVSEHDRQKIRSRLRAVDPPAEAPLHQKRDPAAVVDVGMAQDHCLHIRWIKRKFLKIKLVL